LVDPKTSDDYQLGSWVFCSQRRQLKSAEQLIELTPVHSAILLLLVEHYPEPVASEQLIEHVGAELTRNKLYQGIARLRRIFNDSVHRAHFIGTIPKRGYCLVMEPQRVASSTQRPVAVESSTEQLQNPETGLTSVNVLDDLSFITAAAQAAIKAAQPATKASALEPEPEPELVPELVPEQEFHVEGQLVEEQLVEDKSDEDKSVVESPTDKLLNQQLHTECRADSTNTSTNSSTNASADPNANIQINTNEKLEQPTPEPRVSKRALLVPLLIIISMLAFISARWWFSDNALKVSQPTSSDLVYLTPVTFEVTADNLPARLSPDVLPQVTQNIGWWLKHKVQHIGSRTVVEDQQRDQYPRLDTAVFYAQDGVQIKLTYYDSANSAAIKYATLPLNYRGSWASQPINIGLSRILAPTVTLNLAQEHCEFSQFVGTNERKPQLESGCLISYQQQLLLLNEQLASVAQTVELQVEPPVESEVEQSFSQLISALKQKFPTDSLGYQAAAQWSLRQGDIARAIEQYERVIELNHSQVDNFTALAQLYRQQGQYQLSLRVIHAAQRVAPANKELIYWQARDLVQLGYFARAYQLAKQQVNFSDNVIEKLRFTHLNYDSLAALDSAGLAIADPKLIKAVEQSLANDSLPLDHPIEALGISGQHTVVNLPAKWRYVVLLSANDQLEQALAFVAEHKMTSLPVNDIALVSNQALYLVHYARILQLTGHQKKARSLLLALVDFFSNEPIAPSFYSTHLAQAYALLGNTAKAIEELSRVISTGWLPDNRYDLANLEFNPNFKSVADNFQFLALVELVNQRKVRLNKNRLNLGLDPVKE